MKRPKAVTQTEIEQGLRLIGLEAGDLVFVHSSLSSFGRVEGGADAVVDAILNVIGPEGTLAVPTFNYTPEYFDPAETPSVVGKITETVRLRPDAVRSLHPTHSVAAIGKRARELTEGHEKTHPFGAGSPLHKVCRWNGKILMLGVSHTTTSVIHVAEEMAHVPYLARRRRARVKTPYGIVDLEIRRPGCSRGFDRINEELPGYAGERTQVGGCLMQLYPARAIVEAALRMLDQDPSALLCGAPDCGVCAESRAMIAAATSREARSAVQYGPVRVDWQRRVAEFVDEPRSPESGEGPVSYLRRIALERDRIEELQDGEDRKN